MGGAIVLVVIVVIIVAMVKQAKAKEAAAIAAAPPGAERIESTKTINANALVARYARLGWRVMDQSSSKSFGSAQQTTIRFRKGSE